MLRYTVIRILLLIPILLCVTFIVYALMDLAPGNIVDTMISEEMTQEDIDLLYKKFDLDKPMIVRYFKYLNGLLHGDIGDSQVTGMSVFHLVISRFPNTFRMAILGIVFATIIAIPIGLFNAKHAGTIADNITTAIALVFMSMPSFWLGLMLLIFFANKLKIFPAAYDGTWKCYVLPVVASGVSMSASTIRQTRSAVLEVSRQDFLRTARAKKLGFKKGEEFAKRIEAEGLKMNKETLYKIEQGAQVPNAAQFIVLNLIAFGESAPEKVMDLCMGAQWQGLKEV